MADSIRWFERSAYLALILSIGSSILNTWPAALSNGALLTIQALTTLFQILFIWLIARKRQNWARWVWVGVIGFGTLIAIAIQFVQPSPLANAAGKLAFYLVYIVSVLSAYFLLRRDAAEWFRTR